jgi:hypothetical protein
LVPRRSKVDPAAATAAGDSRSFDAGHPRAIGGIERSIGRATRGRGARGATLGQVVVHEKDGTIPTEHPYRKDPRDVPG